MSTIYLAMDPETEVLIGAGGWAYFNVPGDRLRHYSRVFDTVEVNSTFYVLPDLETVKGWRRRVPGDFEFTVRCHRSLTHTLSMRPVEASFRTYGRMLEVCRALKARVLHLQTPPTFRITPETLDYISDLLSSIDLTKVRVAWEVRNKEQPGYRRLLSLMEGYGVVHSTDLSVEEPAYESDIVYSRLFGRGEHNLYQFTDTELGEIAEKARKSGSRRAYLNFHGVKMYKDAARMKRYEETGRFPRVTRSTGVDSVMEVLREDARFPVTRAELIRHQGWKVCDWKEGERVHVSDILERLPERTFLGLEDIANHLNRLKEQA